MRSFKDAKGRTWDIDVNVDLIEKVMARTQINLSTAAENKFALVDKLLGDMFLRTRILFVLCEDQIAKNGLKPEDFGKGFSGDAMMESATALIQGIADFFDSQTKDLMLRLLEKCIGAATELHQTEGQKLSAILDKITPDGLAATLREKFGDTPASSASTPAGLPLAN